MKKAFFSILAAGILVPALAFAQAPPAGTQAFTFQATANSTAILNAVGQNPDSITLGLTGFEHELAKDLNIKPGKAGHCNDVTAPASVSGFAAGILSKAISNPGDTTWADGSITNTGTSVRGTAVFNSFTTVGKQANTAQALNLSNQGSLGIFCGGASAGAPCGTGQVCKSGKLINNKSSTSDCQANGGYTSDGQGGFFLKTFTYVLCGPTLCPAKPTETLADACGDPLLTIEVNTHTTFNGDGTQSYGTVTDQGDAGATASHK